MKTKQAQEYLASELPEKCRRVQLQLAQLLVDELEGIQAWLVWRHIDSCPVCRQELATARRLSHVLRQADIVPTELRRPVRISENPASSHRPIRAGTTWGWAAILPVAVLAIIFFKWNTAQKLHRQQLATQALLQEVEQKLSQVDTAHWIETKEDYDPGSGQQRRRLKQEWWVRLESPVEMVRHIPQPAPRQGDTSREAQIDWVLTPKERRRYRYSDHSLQVAGGSAALRQRIQSRVDLWGNIEGGSITGARIDKNGRGITWMMEEETLSGRPVIKLTYASDSVGEKKSRDNWLMRIWVGASDHLPVRYESRTLDFSGRKLHETVREQFRFNEKLSDMFFASLAPPNTPVFHDEELEPIKTFHTKKFDEFGAIYRVVGKADYFWGTANWKNFAKACDFDYASSLPRSPLRPGELEKRMRQQIENEKGKSLSYGGNTRGPFFVPYIRIDGVGDVDIPKANAPLLRVEVCQDYIEPQKSNIFGVYRRGYKIICYTLRRDAPSTFKIVGRNSRIEFFR